MKKVTRTKDPTLRQFYNMVENLHKKFNHSSHISVEVKTYDHESGTYKDYWLHWNGQCETIPTWKKVQDKYFNLMES